MTSVSEIDAVSMQSACNEEKREARFGVFRM